jgi:hypothetical protein
LTLTATEFVRVEARLVSMQPNELQEIFDTILKF